MRFVRILFALAIAGIVIGGPYGYYLYKRTSLRNFHVVREGVLYRSGQLSLPGLKRVIFEQGIKTVVTLRYSDNPETAPPDLEEETYCNLMGINHFRIPYRPWWASDGTVPADQGVKTFLKIMNDPAHYPGLVHCFAGIHRTGALCAVYRMEFDHWNNTQAIQEMRNLGYADDHMDVMTYLENYHLQSQPVRNDNYQGPNNIRPASHSTERKAMSDER